MQYLIKIDVVKKFGLTQLQCRINYFKSDYLFHVCSVATNLVTSLDISFQIALLHCCTVLNSSVIIQFIHSAALLQAVIQTKMEPFRNGQVEMRNRAVEMQKELGTLLVPFQVFST